VAQQQHSSPIIGCTLCWQPRSMRLWVGAASAAAAAAAAAVLRDVRLGKQLNLQRTAQHLLLTNQWVALECKMIALARCGLLPAPPEGSCQHTSLPGQAIVRCCYLQQCPARWICSCQTVQCFMQRTLVTPVVQSTLHAQSTHFGHSECSVCAAAGSVLVLM
jgi:hypothetical protein